jgi:hypothetical protein
MLKLNTGSFFTLIAVGTTIFSGAAAFADSVSPTPTNGNQSGEKRDDIKGRCEFMGMFTDASKGGATFSVNCHARIRFDRKDLGEQHPVTGVERREDRDDRLVVECDGQEIYDDGVRVITHDHDSNSERNERVTFAGKGENAPRITVNDLDLRDRDHRRDKDESKATLSFGRWGMSYQIPGRCEFRKDEQHEGNGGAPLN